MKSAQLRCVQKRWSRAAAALIRAVPQHDADSSGVDQILIKQEANCRASSRAAARLGRKRPVWVEKIKDAPLKFFPDAHNRPVWIRITKVKSASVYLKVSAENGTRADSCA
eukprot:6188442-Pleurochrysis_carterae.AAC.3